MNPVRSRDIRESNEKLILRLIREGKGISQSSVVMTTGLRAPTVLRFFNQLEERGFIRRVEREHQRDRQGRKPYYYEPVPEAAYALGMEFWAQSASVVIEDFAGDVVFSQSWSLAASDRRNILGLLRFLFRKALEGSRLPQEKILGLCVAAPGQIDVETGELVQYSRMGVEDINLKKIMEKEFGLPVTVQNNSAAVAWDEYVRGAGKDVKSLFTIMIRAGVGGAFLDDGKVFVTKTHTTLEIGHISVKYPGRPCDCGSHGCLETYLSEGAILADLAPFVKLSSIQEVDEVLEKGDPAVLEVMDKKAGILAQAVRNFISLFGPEIFLIVVRAPGLANYLVDRIRREVREQASNRWQARTQIVARVYNPERAGRGAADLVFKNLFS